MIAIRQEQSADVPAIRLVVEEAFGRSDEADLIDLLRSNGKFNLSLVAEIEGQVVGHILFTGVTMEGADSGPSTLGLAPLAVLTEFQRQGIGSALMRDGLLRCRDMGYEAIVVLGHPEYYPKFGFFPASRYGLRCEYDAPDDAFMVLEIRAGALQACTGLVRYQPEFGEV